MKLHTLGLDAVSSSKGKIGQIFQADTGIFLHENGLPADVIHQYLVGLFGAMSVMYFTIMPIIRQTMWVTLKTDEDLLKRRRIAHYLEAYIQCRLSYERGTSIQEISEGQDFRFQLYFIY
jgi:hypothetical protein